MAQARLDALDLCGGKGVQASPATLDLYVCSFSRDNSAAARTACAQLIAAFAPQHVEKREVMCGATAGAIA